MLRLMTKETAGKLSTLKFVVMRNQMIINEIAKQEIYPITKDAVYEQFMPDVKI
ncbi:hypothetical protein ACFVAD_02555 [Sutcliffiella sp. NPDC057660]|uniref:hypothetical protein n=1 Tax=Sutcliffiella sp. NPDC057660 TaxID=3346199 RepID=UPI0036B6A345